MISNLIGRLEPLLARRFLRFCVVGFSGMFVDMGFLFLIVGDGRDGMRIWIAKAIAAELAMLNNFIWNEVWTFDGLHAPSAGLGGRLFKFHIICGLGIVWAIMLLQLFHHNLGFHLYVANGLSIALVTAWNFALNARFNWRK